MNRRRGHSEKEEGRSLHLSGDMSRNGREEIVSGLLDHSLARYPNLRFNLGHTTGPLLIPCKPQPGFPKENELQGSIVNSMPCMNVYYSDKE